MKNFEYLRGKDGRQRSVVIRYYCYQNSWSSQNSKKHLVLKSVRIWKEGCSSVLQHWYYISEGPRFSPWPLQLKVLGWKVKKRQHGERLSVRVANTGLHGPVSCDCLLSSQMFIASCADAGSTLYSEVPLQLWCCSHFLAVQQTMLKAFKITCLDHGFQLWKSKSKFRSK